MSQGSVIIVLNTSLPCISQHVSLIHVAVCGNGEEEEEEEEEEILHPYCQIYGWK